MAVLRDPAVSSGPAQFGVIQGAAQSLGVEVSPVNVRDVPQMERAVAAFARSGNGGLIVTGSGLATIHRDLIVALATRHKLPTVYSNRVFVTAGGLISYGPDYVDLYRQAASGIGASGNLEDMRLALGKKLSTSHRVILIDRPGHGWSSRPRCDDCASPARQAEFVAGALEQLGVQRAIIIGHSWGGALATAYALAFPERTAGLVLLSAPTHPWPGDPGWYNRLALLPYVGPLFLRTCVYPLGVLMAESASRRVFEPQALPDDYIRRAAIRLVLRPKTFYSNAMDLALLESFIAAQVPRYVYLRTPTVIITGNRDTMVSSQINAHALAATLPCAKLVLLNDIGHMSHHAAPDVVVAAVDELMSRAA